MDDVTIRRAVPEDKTGVADFTSGTFAWGDYVQDAWDGWMEDERGRAFVATKADRTVGLARVVMVSDREAWLHAARVHPDLRRRGIGIRLNDRCVAWAVEQGAVVARLVIEDWNETAQGQVTKLGYRPVSSWVYGTRTVARPSPDATGNGGQRAPAEKRLQRAPAAEIEPAYLAWAGGHLARAGRELIEDHWSWRRFSVEDLRDAASRHRFWESPHGWIVGGPEHRDPSAFRVVWAATTPEAAYELAKATVDRAIDSGASDLHVQLPALVWVVDALERNGLETSTSTIFEKLLG